MHYLVSSVLSMRLQTNLDFFWIFFVESKSGNEELCSRYMWEMKTQMNYGKKEE